MQNYIKTGIIIRLFEITALSGGVKVSTGKLIYDKRAEVAEAL